MQKSLVYCDDRWILSLRFEANDAAKSIPFKRVPVSWILRAPQRHLRVRPRKSSLVKSEASRPTFILSSYIRYFPRRNGETLALTEFSMARSFVVLAAKLWACRFKIRFSYENSFKLWESRCRCYM